MFNYLIKIEYVGTNFVGWQSQKNGKTVQDAIEIALKKVLKIKIRIIGAGRTDKGVHAFAQHANFKTERKIENETTFLESLTASPTPMFITILSILGTAKIFL